MKRTEVALIHHPCSSVSLLLNPWGFLYAPFRANVVLELICRAGRKRLVSGVCKLLARHRSRLRTGVEGVKRSDASLMRKVVCLSTVSKGRAGIKFGEALRPVR